jgi:hypothetical protein
MEGKELNDILSHYPQGREIPSNALTYNYNSNFIIASQKPSKTDDPLYQKVAYRDGRDAIYYWVIVHSKKLTLGPMSKMEFERARQAYGVPENFVLKPLIGNKYC